MEKHARDVRADSVGDDRWQTRDSHTVHHAARARRTVVCKGRGEQLSGEILNTAKIMERCWVESGLSKRVCQGAMLEVLT